MLVFTEVYMYMDIWSNETDVFGEYSMAIQIFICGSYGGIT